MRAAKALDSSPSAARPIWLAALAAGALAVLCYANSMAGDFVWDDRILILEGELPKAWNRLADIFTKDFFARSEFDVVYGYYRPLATVSYLLDYTFWKLDPRGYHLTNLALHAFASALVVAVSRRLGWTARSAALAGLLFAAHPIHSESVAWIAGRTDPLAFVLALTATWFALAPTPLARHKLASAAAFALALLAKETAVVVPLWVAAFLFVRGDQARAVAARILPYAGVLAAYVVWRFLIIDVATPGHPSEHTASAVALSLAPTLARYLSWMAWPTNQSAYVLNPYVRSIFDPRFGAGMAALGLLVGLAIVGERRLPHRQVLLGCLLLAAALIPNCNLVRPASPPDMGATMAERFCYFPSFPFLALVAAVIDWAFDRARGPWRSGVAIAAASLLLAYGASTIARNRVWANERTFLDDTLAKAPDAVLLWGRLAGYHLGRHELEDAEAAVRRADAIQPNSSHILPVKALLLVMRDRPHEAVTLQEELAKTAKRGLSPVKNNLAYLYRLTGRRHEARRLLEELIAAGHGYSDVYANLAEIERAEGDREGARRHYAAAMADRPDDLQVAAAWVSLEVDAGDAAAAEAIYRRQLDYHPSNARILNNIAMIRSNAGDLAGAEELLEQILAKEPTYASARVNLAQVLVRRGRRREAIEQLRAARPLTKDPQLLSVIDAQSAEWAKE